MGYEPLMINSLITITKSCCGNGYYRHMKKISFLFYTIGIIWFVCLPNFMFNFETYIGFKALKVHPKENQTYKSDSSNILRNELKQEMQKHKLNIPLPWLAEKMKNIGLETHVQNFTYTDPLRKEKTVQGQNIYGILRAPRSSSTEGIVISTPYRSLSSNHPRIMDSIPVLLNIAKEASEKIYWSKDLIFLITEHEEIGLQAWLNAYYNIENDSLLKTNKLLARSGNLISAINLEIQSIYFQYINFKIEGLNGRLPNLDLFNTAYSIAYNLNISSGYKQSSETLKIAENQSFTKNLLDMVKMVKSTAIGEPTGLHGIFLKHKIESLTIEAIKLETKTNIKKGDSLYNLIYQCLRCLNNLTAIMYRSFFFYLLIGCDRYVSIGDYIPCIILLAGSLFIKALILWDRFTNQYSNKTSQYFRWKDIINIIGISMSFGIFVRYILLHEDVNSFFGFKNTHLALTVLFICISAIAAVIPIFFQMTTVGYEILHIFTLFYLGTALIVIGLLNFSLGFLLSILIVPLAISIDLKQTLPLKYFNILYAVFLQPLIIILIIQLVIEFTNYPQLSSLSIIGKSLEATVESIYASVFNLMIYNNWQFTIWSLILFPGWIFCWVLILPKFSICDSIF